MAGGAPTPPCHRLEAGGRRTKGAVVERPDPEVRNPDGVRHVHAPRMARWPVAEPAGGRSNHPRLLDGPGARRRDMDRLTGGDRGVPRCHRSGGSNAPSDAGLTGADRSGHEGASNRGPSDSDDLPSHAVPTGTSFPKARSQPERRSRKRDSQPERRSSQPERRSGERGRKWERRSAFRSTYVRIHVYRSTGGGRAGARARRRRGRGGGRPRARDQPGGGVQSSAPLVQSPLRSLHTCARCGRQWRIHFGNVCQRCHLQVGDPVPPPPDPNADPF